VSRDVVEWGSKDLLLLFAGREDASPATSNFAKDPHYLLMIASVAEGPPPFLFRTCVMLTFVL